MFPVPCALCPVSLAQARRRKIAILEVEKAYASGIGVPGGDGPVNGKSLAVPHQGEDGEVTSAAQVAVGRRGSEGATRNRWAMSTVARKALFLSLQAGAAAGLSAMAVSHKDRVTAKVPWVKVRIKVMVPQTGVTDRCDRQVSEALVNPALPFGVNSAKVGLAPPMVYLLMGLDYNGFFSLEEYAYVG